MVIAKASSIEAAIGGAAVRLDTGTPAAKQAAFDRLHDWLRRLPGEHDLQREVTALCARYGVDEAAICRELCMSWDELKSFAADPLVNFGAHSITHCNLAKQSEEIASKEMSVSRARIESALQRPVLHLAYPYGDKIAAGAREFALARTAGFKTAVTTRPGMIFAGKCRASDRAAAGFAQRQLSGRPYPADPDLRRRHRDVERFSAYRRGVSGLPSSLRARGRRAILELSPVPRLKTADKFNGGRHVQGSVFAAGPHRAGDRRIARHRQDDRSGFLAQGAAKVYITARKAAPCEATAKELSAEYDGECIALPIDISTMAGIDMLAAEIKKREPKLDILVNNAGAAWGAEFDEFPESGWDKVMNLNVKTPFFLTKALAAPLRAAATAERPAKVINIASIDGIFVNPMETYSYAASKSGLIHLTRRMATKLIKDNINVTAIAPGAFKSDMNRAARDHADDVAKRVPARRVGTDEDMAGVAIYLASRAGDYVVGATIAVDGGVVYASAGLEIAG